MKIIGLTGGIASGKSTAAHYLSQSGIPIIDADVVAREIVRPNMPALKAIVKTFGKEMLHSDGTLNREKLGSVVFEDPQALKTLNNITHPHIRNRILAMIGHIEESKTYPAIIIDAALLIETGWQVLVDDVWLIVIDEALQIKRLIKRSGLTESQAKNRIARQMPQDLKKQHATVYIDNNHGLDALYHQLDELLQTIM